MFGKSCDQGIRALQALVATIFLKGTLRDIKQSVVLDLVLGSDQSEKILFKPYRKISGT